MWLVLWLWVPFGPYLYKMPYGFLFNVVFGASLVLLLMSTIALDHSAMFGLKQGYASWKGKEMPASGLKTKGIFGIVRHPITSLLIVALWSHETMTAGRLLFNLLFSLYAILGTIFEEKDLAKNFGEDYSEYCRKVPAFIPRLGQR